MRTSLLFVSSVVACVICMLNYADLKAQDSTAASLTNRKALDTIAPVVTNGVNIQALSNPFNKALNTVPKQYVDTRPYVSLQQMIKGNLAGVHVQEPTGEPGTEQSIFIRGISSPLLSKRELFDNQAAVFLNGIPLTQDNPFAYEIQQYDFNRIGPATNLFASISPENIESIQVIKDPVTLASLGPIAANGAIWITTKNANAGYRQINVNSYFGIAARPQVTAVNAAYENQFRQPFYEKYGTINDRLNYPSYLRDSTNADYYGPANWTDLYYRNAALYSADLSLAGGSERANFRFFAGATKNAGNADATKLERYTGSFFINVAPLKWLMVSSMINYNRLNRTRNRNIRDRLAEQRYLPDLTNPLTPNKELYRSYLDEFSKAIDDNINHLIQGYVALTAKAGPLLYTGRLGFDYNEGTRDAFWPTTLLEKNNFVSNYFGYNRRFIITNSLQYGFKLGEKNKFSVEAGQNYWTDLYKYDYAYAYNGPNDFTKINVVNGNPNDGDYLQSKGFQVYYFPSRMQNRLVSFSGNASYAYNDIVQLNVLVRRDGSSNRQPDNRWFTSWSGGVEWKLDRHLLRDHQLINSLSLVASYGRIGKLINDDRFNAGPQYRVDLGWTGEPTIGSYMGIPGLSRPYTSGWVGYDIPWAYSDQFNAGVRLGILNNKLRISVDVYSKEDKEMLLPIPIPAEYGYTGAYKPGMAVNNKGVDLSVAADILPKGKRSISWLFTANANYNRNQLKALPDGLQELIIGNNKLVVGKPIDAFWVLENNGIYTSDADVPKHPSSGHPLSYQGLALKAGDPQWRDVNGDFDINDKDKVLKGNFLPKVTGGFGSSIGYRSFTLDFQFYVALGHKVWNQYAASRLDFINTEANNNINSVKEITFWEKKMDLTRYPLYNPWSSVVPYRIDQDLFLDDASFLKLRSVSLSYDFVPRLLDSGKRRIFRDATLYVTATNVFTITKFKGDDPELAGYNGIYSGYGMPLPRQFTVGFRIGL